MVGFEMVENAINNLSLSAKITGEDIEVTLRRRQISKKSHSFSVRESCKKYPKVKIIIVN